MGWWLLGASPGASRVVAGTYLVTSPAFNGPGSLAQALLDANASPGLDRIEFRVPTSLALRTNDFPNFREFGQRLIAHPDPVSSLLWSAIPEERQNTLIRFIDTPDVLARTAESMIAPINALLQGASLYTPERFAGVALAPETEALRQSNPVGEDLLRLNRWLVVDALPGLVLRTNPSGNTVDIVASVLTATDPVEIDGTTQPGYAGFPLVAIRSTGTLTPEQARGLIVTGGSLVKGLAFVGYRANGQGRALNLQGQGNTVVACAFGVDPRGAITNVQENGTGLYVDNSSGNVIGGSRPEDRNYFLNAGAYGLLLEGPGASNNVVRGNSFGGYREGDSWRERRCIVGLGIKNARSNTVGGPGAGDGNWFVANDTSLEVSGPEFGSLLFEGNIAGMRPDGSLPASLDRIAGGVVIRGGAGSLIRSNAMTSFTLAGSNHVVHGNTFNTDPAGRTRLSSRTLPASFSAPRSVIGGPEPGQANLFAGTGSEAVRVSGAGARFWHNFVGTGWDGRPITNLAAAANSAALEFGDVEAVAERNLIAGNLGIGVRGFGSSTLIRDNVIRGNAGAGIQLSNRAVFTNNVVEGNGGAGVVQISGANVTGNRITGKGLAIDRIGDGPTANVTRNANNFPVITNATVTISNGVWTVAGGGRYAAAPNDARAIEIFLSDTNGPAGRGDLKVFAGRTPVTTDAAGNGTFEFALSLPAPADLVRPSGAGVLHAARPPRRLHDGEEPQVYVAGVVLPGGKGADTSEPGSSLLAAVLGIPAVLPPPSTVDVGVSATAAILPTPPGELKAGYYDVVYTVTVTNRLDSQPAKDVEVLVDVLKRFPGSAVTTRELPAGSNRILFTPPPQAEPGAPVEGRIALLAPGESVTFEVMVRQLLLDPTAHAGRGGLPDTLFTSGLAYPGFGLIAHVSALGDRDLTKASVYEPGPRLPNLATVHAPTPSPVELPTTPTLTLTRNPADATAVVQGTPLPQGTTSALVGASSLDELLEFVAEGFSRETLEQSLSATWTVPLPPGAGIRFFQQYGVVVPQVNVFTTVAEGGEGGGPVVIGTGVELQGGGADTGRAGLPDWISLKWGLDGDEWTVPGPVSTSPYGLYLPSSGGDLVFLPEEGGPPKKIELTTRKEGQPVSPPNPLSIVWRFKVYGTAVLQDGTRKSLTLSSYPNSAVAPTPDPWGRGAPLPVNRTATVARSVGPDQQPVPIANLEQDVAQCAVVADVLSLIYLQTLSPSAPILPYPLTAEALTQFIKDYGQQVGYEKGAGVGDDWTARKRADFENKGIPVAVKSTVDVVEAMKALDEGAAVLIALRRVEQNPVDPGQVIVAGGHAALVGRITEYSDGTYAVNLVHDLLQGDDRAGRVESLHWFKPPSRFFGGLQWPEPPKKSGSGENETKPVKPQVWMVEQFIIHRKT